MNNIYDNCFPLRVSPSRVARGHSRLRKPWMSFSLLRCLKRRNGLFRRFLVSRDPVLWTRFKRYRNSVVSMVRRAKAHYYHTCFSDCRGSRDYWRALNGLCRPSTTTSLDVKLIVDGVEVPSAQTASVFAHHYDSLSCRNSFREPPLGPSHHDFLRRYYGDSTVDSCFLSPVTDSEVLSILYRVKANMADGPDGCSPFILKCVSNFLVPPLTYLINLMLRSGRFPQFLKKTVVIPILKRGDSANVANYRPISHVSYLSKVFEKVILQRLSEFVIAQNILSPVQFGGQRHRSTEMALSFFFHLILDSLDRSDSAIAYFLDVTRAYDSVNHVILLDKLSYLGIRGPALELIRSFLMSRPNSVFINNSFSFSYVPTIGIPQGSCLGPLLFIIFFNDLLFSSRYARPIAYMDDVTICFSIPKLHDAALEVNREIVAYTDWYVANCLAINIQKTTIMVFSLVSRIFHSSTEFVLCTVPVVTSPWVKFLGIIIQANLKFDLHIDFISRRIRAAIGMITRCVFFLPVRALFDLYYAFIYSYVNYCIAIWGSLSTRYLMQRLIVLINRFFRLVAYKLDMTRTGFMARFNLFNLHTVYLFRILLFTHRRIYDASYSLFSTSGLLHLYGTRLQNYLVVPLVRTQFFHRFFLSDGLRRWNVLPSELRSISSFNLFRRSLRDYLRVSTVPE